MKNNKKALSNKKSKTLTKRKLYFICVKTVMLVWFWSRMKIFLVLKNVLPRNRVLSITFSLENSKAKNVVPINNHKKTLKSKIYFWDLNLCASEEQINIYFVINVVVLNFVTEFFFQGTENIERLDLSRNLLTSIPSNILDPMRNLSILNAGCNNLLHVDHLFDVTQPRVR